MLEVGFAGYGEESGFYNIPVPAFNNRIEKFAELIVKECCRVVRDIPIDELEPHSVILAKHFGFEE